MTDKLSERLEALMAAAEPTDDAERDHNAPDAECVFADMRPAEFEALLREAAELARRVEWRPIETAPKSAGRYLVTNGEDVREARWQPRLGNWVFPSAQAGIRRVSHWMPLPEPPEVG